MSVCELPPCSGTQTSAIITGLKHFINLRFGVIFREARLQVVGHCPLNTVAVVGLVAHQLQNVGGHIFENGRLKNLAGQA